MIAERLTKIGAADLLSPLLPREHGDTSSAELRVLGPEESVELVSLCQNNRLAPILADAVHTGRLALAEDAIPELSFAVEHFLASQLRVERQGIAAIDALIGEGIDFRVMKGLATAYLDYPNPALRPVGDLDVLVRDVDMPTALRVLSKIEGGRFLTVPGDDWRVTHAIPFLLNDIEIDVHNRLLHQAAGHCAASLDLFADPDSYEIAGRTVFALPPWLRLIQAASQNVLGGYQQVSSDLDVARLAEHVDQALERAGEVGLGWVVHEGVKRSQQNLGWGPLVAHRRATTWRDRWFRRIYVHRDSTVLERTMFELTNAEPRIAIAIIRGALRPGDAYLEKRGRSASEQISRQLKRLRHTRS